MSRHNKTFAPRAEKSEAQTNDNKEDEKKYEQISNQDSKISLAKTEVTQITYGPFRTRAFRKIETGSARIQLLESGPHVLILNQALNALGHKVDVNEDTFRDKTQIALINFQQKNGLTGSGIFDRETLLKMNEALENLHKMEETSSQQKESQILPASTPPDEKVQISVGVIPMNIQSNQEFFEYLDIQVFGRIVDATWDIGKNTYKNYIGKETSCTVSVSSLKKHLGITDQQWEAMYKRKTSAKPSAAELRNFVKGHLKNQEKAISEEINAIKKEAGALSADKKQFIRDATSKIDYLQNRRILDLLKQLSDGEMADYKNKVSKETTDLAEIEESLKAYIETRNKNLKNQNELETVKTKLYGLEDLYDRYIKYTNISPTTNIGTIKEPVIVDNPNHIAANKSLTQAMIANGFASIEEFQTYITRYENAFETETVRIGVEMLQQYKHNLYEEEKRLNDDALLNGLLQGITKSGAKQNFEDAERAERAARVFTDRPNQEQIDSGNRMKAEAGQKEMQGNNAILSLSAYTPLISEENFDKKEFATITNTKDLKAFLHNYIISQTQSVNNVINNIQEKTESIYELDKLYRLSYARQNIKEGSIYKSIIQTKRDQLSGKKALLAISKGIFAAALIAVTWGAATPVVIAGGALSLAMSIDVAYQTINEYKNNKEFHDLGLLSDDPSLFWVVIAIAGVALDAAALSTVLKSAKPIAKAATDFNDTENTAKALFKLENDLAKIKDLNDKVQKNIVKQAVLEREIKEALKAAKNSMFTANMMINPEFAIKLIPVAIKYIKSGILNFEKFLIELQTAKLIKDIEKLSPEELSLLKKTFEEAKKQIPRLDETAKFWQVTNQAGTELRWTNIREKDLEKSIDAALKSSNSGKNWEGEVARELSKYDEITDFSNEFKIIENGTVKNIAGDIDVGSSKYIIECKESISHNTLTTKMPDGSYKFLNQFDKYLNQNNIKYINIKNRQVVLVIKNFGKNTDISHPILKQLQDKGVIIITDLNQIKNLK
ncbi:peptidoglycan-binding protein [Chryseobacterium arthrosphaerae]|uniref:peptidoglycan-binding domain-containing protein n=1 Tax=Chryseobacterium arthrosphaerae TaxID=651561 RepID=UPI001E3772B5|nr:peptidoglycan-binding domain-containing protein [Chryseobacterium arthrosphaerae]UEQ78243.1 peptidoglycan-binding protein [Chryseobacterium arthrosphaerae]